MLQHFDFVTYVIGSNKFAYKKKINTSYTLRKIIYYTHFIYNGIYSIPKKYSLLLGIQYEPLSLQELQIKLYSQRFKKNLTYENNYDVWGVNFTLLNMRNTSPSSLMGVILGRINEPHFK